MTIPCPIKSDRLPDILGLGRDVCGAKSEQVRRQAGHRVGTAHHGQVTGLMPVPGVEEHDEERNAAAGRGEFHPGRNAGVFFRSVGAGFRAGRGLRPKNPLLKPRGWGARNPGFQLFLQRIRAHNFLLSCRPAVFAGHNDIFPPRCSERSRATGQFLQKCAGARS